MTKKITLSYTQNQVRKQCKRKWYLKYQQEIEEAGPKSEALVFGEFVHLVLAQYMREHYQDFSNQQIDSICVMGIIHKMWDELEGRKVLSEKNSYMKIENALYGLVLKALITLKQDYQMIYMFQGKPVIELELTIDNFYTGIIDLVYVDKRGRIVLLDWKTTSYLYTNHQVKQSEQLVGYAWLLEQNGVTVDMVAYGVLHKKDKTAKLMKVKNNQDYKDFVKEIKRIKITNEHNLRLHRGKSQLPNFPRNEESCYAYRVECPFYNQCWGMDSREVETVEIYV